MQRTVELGRLPNLRELIIPDEGKTIIDMDLDSADLRVVVAEAGEAEMQKMLDEGKKVYVEVAREYYKDPTFTKYHPKYITFKSLCHGTNYYGKPRGLAMQTGLLVHEVERVQAWYFGKFPAIPAWHKSLISNLHRTRSVSNRFGFRRFYFDRIESCYNEAFAWIPQSTVALIINTALCNISERVPSVDVLLQVHDSLTMQTRTELLRDSITAIRREAAISVPYTPPLVIPVGFKTSSSSWGAAKEYND